MAKVPQQPPAESIGKRIARLRRAAGLTQAALAVRIGCSVGTLRNWEGNHRVPSLESAAMLADALGCSIDTIWGRSSS